MTTTTVPRTNSEPRNRFGKLIDAYVAAQRNVAAPGVAGKVSSFEAKEKEKQLQKIARLGEKREELEGVFESATRNLFTQKMFDANAAVEKAMEKTGWTIPELDNEIAILMEQYKSPDALNVTPERKRIETSGLVHRMTDNPDSKLSAETIQDYVQFSVRAKQAAVLADQAMNVIETLFPLKQDTIDIKVRGRMRDTTRALVPIFSDEDSSKFGEARAALNDFEHDILAAARKALGMPAPSQSAKR